MCLNFVTFGEKTIQSIYFKPIIERLISNFTFNIETKGLKIQEKCYFQ